MRTVFSSINKFGKTNYCGKPIFTADLSVCVWVYVEFTRLVGLLEMNRNSVVCAEKS